METYNVETLTLEQAKKILKTPICNRCNAFISWDKKARDAKNTTKPLNPDKSDIHSCQDGDTDYEAVKLIAKAKELEAEAAATATTKNQIGGVGNATNSSLDAYQNGAMIALAVEIGKMQEIVKKQDETITKILGAVEEQRKLMSDYLTNNPYALSMNNLIEVLLKYLPEQEVTKPTTADKLKKEKV